MNGDSDSKPSNAIFFNSYIISGFFYKNKIICGGAIL